jgi:hypothetical protein
LNKVIAFLLAAIFIFMTILVPAQLIRSYFQSGSVNILDFSGQRSPPTTAPVTAPTRTAVAPSSSLPVTKPAASPASPDLAILVPVASQTLSPSPTEQVIGNDQVSVIIPGGLLTKSELLTISRVDNALPSKFEGFAPLAAFDVTLGNLKEFAKNLTVEIAYDPAKLPGNLPADQSILAEWWDPGQNIWWRTLSQVNTKRNKVVISTNHLSRWRITMIIRGDIEWPSQHFIVVWNPNEAPIIGKTQQNPKEFARKVSEYLEAAWQKYFTERYAVAPGSKDETWPTDWPNNVEIGKTWVVIDQNIADSETQTVSGDITLKSIYDNEDQLKQDTAHELFHNTHLRKVRMPTYIQSQWWAEATADYAATRVAWDNLTGMSLISGEYFRSPLMTVNAKHDYETARFVEFLVGKFLVDKGLAFTQLFNDMAQSVPTAESLALIVQKKTGKSLLEQYRDFVIYVCFDSAGPIAKEAIQPSLHEGPVGPKELPKSFAADATEISFTSGCFERYAAWLWGFDVFTSKTTGARRTSIQITVQVGNSVNEGNFYMGVYVLKNDERIPGGTLPQPLILPGKGSVEINVSDGDVVYILAVNADTRYHSWDLVVKDNSPTSLQGVKKFSWDYNSAIGPAGKLNHAEGSLTWQMTSPGSSLDVDQALGDVYLDVKPNVPIRLAVTGQGTLNTPTERVNQSDGGYSVANYKITLDCTRPVSMGKALGTINQTEGSIILDFSLPGASTSVLGGFVIKYYVEDYNKDGVLTRKNEGMVLPWKSFTIYISPGS